MVAADDDGLVNRAVDVQVAVAIHPDAAAVRCVAGDGYRPRVTYEP